MELIEVNQGDVKFYHAAWVQITMDQKICLFTFEAPDVVDNLIIVEMFNSLKMGPFSTSLVELGRFPEFLICQFSSCIYLCSYLVLSFSTVFFLHLRCSFMVYKRKGGWPTGQSSDEK